MHWARTLIPGTENSVGILFEITALGPNQLGSNKIKCRVHRQTLVIIQNASAITRIILNIT